MYQAPGGERTEAWNPMRAQVGVDRRRRGRRCPRPVYVVISGCLAARPGAMIADSASANRWKVPFGAGQGNDERVGVRGLRELVRRAREHLSSRLAASA